MNKRLIFVIIGVVIIALLAWYLVSPLFIVKEVNEESPLIKDSLNSMSSEERAEFDDAVENSEGVEMEEKMPSSAVVTLMGDFKPRAHEVKGKSLVIDDNGKKILRFEDFETVNGPNLHIYLSSDLGDGDFIDLGEIRATKGNVNYEIPDNVDLEKYDKVLVWCVPFKVLFSYAELE